MKNIRHIASFLGVFTIIACLGAQSSESIGESGSIEKSVPVAEDHTVDRFYQNFDDYVAVSNFYREQHLALRMARREVALDNMDLPESELEEVLNAFERENREWALELELMSRQMANLRRKSVAALREYNGLPNMSEISAEIEGESQQLHIVDAVNAEGGSGGVPPELRERYVEDLQAARIEALVSAATEHNKE